MSGNPSSKPSLIAFLCLAAKVCLTSSDLPPVRIERQATQNAFVPSLGIFRNQGLKNGSESQLSNFDRFDLG